MSKIVPLPKTNFVVPLPEGKNLAPLLTFCWCPCVLRTPSFPVRRTSLSLHYTTLPPKHNAGISGIEEEEEEEGALSRNDPKRSLCHIRNTGGKLHYVPFLLNERGFLEQTNKLFNNQPHICHPLRGNFTNSFSSPSSNPTLFLTLRKHGDDRR